MLYSWGGITILEEGRRNISPGLQSRPYIAKVLTLWCKDFSDMQFVGVPNFFTEPIIATQFNSFILLPVQLISNPMQFPKCSIQFHGMAMSEIELNSHGMNCDGYIQ